MTVFFILQKKIFKKKYNSELMKLCNLELFFLEGNDWKLALKKNNYHSIILFTENLLSREDKNYKLLSRYVLNKNCYFAEFSIKKNNKLNMSKSSSKAIIQGFGILNWQFIKKVIQIQINEIKK